MKGRFWETCRMNSNADGSEGRMVMVWGLRSLYVVRRSWRDQNGGQ